MIGNYRLYQYREHTKFLRKHNFDQTADIIEELCKEVDRLKDYKAKIHRQRQAKAAS